MKLLRQMFKGGWNRLPTSGGNFKILKFESRKWHLQHSENTFCKKLGFQNTVLMMRFVIDHMLSIENQHFRENIYMIMYFCESNGIARRFNLINMPITM